MMTGIVNAKGEALIRIVVDDFGDRRMLIDAVIDTGYTGFLILPTNTISELELPWTGREDVILGDGSMYEFEVYSGRVIWDGEYCAIKIHASHTETLVGTGILYGYEVCIQTIKDGEVKIQLIS
ncbi:MAG: clan AA aspartic protease [Alkalinema sp. RU_4_3]|nr:clan AA aspartic protease [Alkalinema sp. RU_4_3]